MIALLIVPSVFAARKKDKAGKVKDYVYTDKKFNFSLNLNDDWKYKIQKNKGDFRIAFTQVKYGIPSDYANTPDYTKIPRIVVFVVESKLAPRAFVDSLISDSYKSKAKKTVLKEFEILTMMSSTGFVPERLLTRKKKTLQFDKSKGYSWTGQVKYTNEIATSANSVGGKRVKGGFGGGMVAVKDGDNLIVFHVISEWDYFGEVFEEAMSIINTLKLNN